MPVPAAHRLGVPERGQDGLFSRVGCGLEQAIKQLFMQHRECGHGFADLLRDGVGSRKGQRDIAAAMTQVRTRACKSCASTCRQPAQLTRVQRGVGGQQHDDGTFIEFRSLPVSGSEPDPKRLTEHDQIAQPAKIRQHQRADGVMGTSVLVLCARRGMRCAVR